MVDLEERLDNVDFAVDKSMRYHQRRRNFFEWLHKGVMFFVIVFGSAAFASLLGWSRFFGALTAVLGAADLVFNFSHRARDHEILYRRFSELASDMKKEQKPSEDQIIQFQRRRIAIEADEPPIYRALEASCDNEATIARGWEKDNGLILLSFTQRTFMNFFTFEKDALPRTPPINTAAESHT